MRHNARAAGLPAPALFRFAMTSSLAPWASRPSLSGSEEKFDMLQYCVQTLTERGYVFIGMDHFAKPDDELSIALKEGFLQRNFQGYSTYADCDLVAIGVSSIGKIGSTYSQNERDIDAYYSALDAGHLPITL